MGNLEHDVSDVRKDAQEVLTKLIDANKQSAPSEATVQSWVAAQTADGGFSDLLYPPNNRPVADVGVLTEHLERLKGIGNYCHAHASSTYAGNAALGLRFYAVRDFKTQNWWFRNIGLARSACIAALLVCRHVPYEQLRIFIEYMEACTNLDAAMTGGNRSDYAHIQLMWSTVGGSQSLQAHFLERMKACYQAMSLLCFPVSRQGPPDNGEGFVSDLSFSQHNVGKSDGTVYHQLYAAGYGTEMVKSIFRFLMAQSGTLSLDTDAQAITEVSIIQGLAWMSYGLWFDPHTTGRGIASPTKNAGEVLNWARTLKGMNPLLPDVLNEIIHRIGQNDETRNAFYIGSRYFWINEFLCHLQPNFYLRTKNISTRTVGSESGNGANLKGYYVGNGTTFFGTRGDEYKDIAAVWDWQRLPGTTVEQVPGFKFPLIEWGMGAWGSSDYSGGVGSHEAGMASMILSKGAVANARKSVFTFRGRAFFLGSGIDTTAAANPVVTTVNQCLQAGDAFQQLADSAASLEFVHDGLCYKVQKNDNQVSAYSQAQQGRWRDINTGGSDELITRQVFSLQIEHPRSRNAVYAYEVHAQDLGGGQVDMHYDEKMHVVRSYEEKFFFAALFDTANMQPLLIKPDVAFTSSIPILLYVNYDDGLLRLSCADPQQRSESVRIDFYDGSNVQTGTLTIKLDQGSHAGATKSVSYDPASRSVSGVGSS